MKHPVVIIGAGPAGLATAGALRMRGIRSVVLEGSEQIAPSWRRHYDRLHLHTPARFSALPGLPIPKRFGRWVSRDDVVRYLEQYADFQALDVRTGTSVTGLRRAGEDDQEWVVSTSAGDLSASAVVVATGYNNTPATPPWPGRESFSGELVHASSYRNGSPYAGRRVLVVGIGNTGAEIATDLAEHGAAEVLIAVRTPPHIVRRDRGPMSAQLSGIAARRLPTRVVDAVGRRMSALDIPDLSDFGLPKPERGLYTRVREGAIPIQDVGIVDAIRSQQVRVVPAVERIFGDDVVLRGGARVQPDVIIEATGYRRGLDELLAGLDVLDSDGDPLIYDTRAKHPNLYFNGYTNPISGMLREIRIDANKIAKQISAQLYP